MATETSYRKPFIASFDCAGREKICDTCRKKHRIASNDDISQSVFAGDPKFGYATCPHCGQESLHIFTRNYLSEDLLYIIPLVAYVGILAGAIFCYPFGWWGVLPAALSMVVAGKWLWSRDGIRHI